MTLPTDIQPLSPTCLVCQGPLEAVIELPGLPLTGLYSRKAPQADFPTYDQALMLCTTCGHGQLKNAVNPLRLYDQSYGFRTSASQTARRGAHFFADYLEALFPQRVFPRIVEFGCNDAYLLQLLHARGERLLGVDPILAENPPEIIGKDKIQMVGGRVEEVDFVATLGGKPDLVLSQHTLEHLTQPRALLEQLFRQTHEDTLFLFEFPCFDPLLEQYRFDQVFHQHLHYFSVDSVKRLLSECGGTLLAYQFHYTYWGALQVLFQKKGGRSPRRMEQEQGHHPPPPAKTVAEIQARYRLFRDQMRQTRQILEKIPPERLYGYGAALMLPILAYHLENDGGLFRAILDDDPEKDGLGYVNLPCRIRHPGGLDLSRLSICLTAMDNRRPILKKLATVNPQQIITPLNMI